MCFFAARSTNPSRRVKATFHRRLLFHNTQPQHHQQMFPPNTCINSIISSLASSTEAVILSSNLEHHASFDDHQINMGKSAMTAKAALAAKAQEAKACKLAAAQERQGKEKNQFISAKQSSEHRGASKIKELLPFGPKGIKPAPPVPEKVNKHPRYPLVGTQFEHHVSYCHISLFPSPWLHTTFALFRCSNLAGSQYARFKSAIFRCADDHISGLFPLYAGLAGHVWSTGVNGCCLLLDAMDRRISYMSSRRYSRRILTFQSTRAAICLTAATLCRSQQQGAKYMLTRDIVLVLQGCNNVQLFRQRTLLLV